MSGSYINWAFNISDLDSRPSTVSNPVNNTSSEKFGGVGTTHHHVRIPTHQGYAEHVNWMLYNRPTKPQIYILNSNNHEVAENISSIMCHDPDGIFIHIHDGNNSLINAYGWINAITKWPTYFRANGYFRAGAFVFDPFNCAQNKEFRNWFFTTGDFNLQNPPMDQARLNTLIQSYIQWYQIRHTYQPHEVNNTTYITDISTENRIFELTCYDVVTDKFLDIFKDIITQSNASDNFDLTHLNEFHQTYIDAQPNLQWFKSVEHWRSTGLVDEYLSSHSLIQGCLIREMFQNLNIDQQARNYTNWTLFYNDVKDESWPACRYEWEFSVLPDNIKSELVNVFNYKPMVVLPKELVDFLYLCQTADLEEINTCYQKIINTQSSLV